MKKKCKVVMLPTNEEAEVRYGYYKDVISLTNSRHHNYLELFRSMNGIDIPNPQHLYITSDDKIKKGDYVIDSMGELFGPYEEVDIIGAEAKKIIATTDTLWKHDGTVFSPKPSTAFINKYVKEYNKGNIITDVMVEYECNYDEMYENDVVIPKIDSNNEITITKVKDSWDEEELHFIMYEYHKYCDSVGYITPREWINEHLK